MKKKKKANSLLIKETQGPIPQTPPPHTDPFFNP